MSPPRAQVIVALDVPDLPSAQALVSRLGPSATYVKVGLELFTTAGPRVVEWLRGEGREVFLDLKLHDIPNTVRAASRNAARLGASLLTAHAYGGAAMLAAAVQGAAEGSSGSACGVLAVTVLTSTDARGLGAALGRDVPEMGAEVLRLAGVAHAVRAHGVVCSGHEVAAVRSTYPGLRPLVPGLRLAGGLSHDQARVATPERAAADGAAYLVVGRAITESVDPAETLARIIATIG